MSTPPHVAGGGGLESGYQQWWRQKHGAGGRAHQRRPTSKYDYVKVRVWLGAQGDHYYILSRFLVSRTLTVTKIPSVVAIKMALELKKQLVDANLLDISQENLEVHLFKVMENRGYGPEFVRRYRMMSSFHQQRIPLMILFSGTACVGKSTLATQLAQRLNLPNVLQTDLIYELLRTTPGSPLKNMPLWRRGLGRGALVEEYVRESRVVRRGVSGDIKKCVTDGKSMIVEGMHVDPQLYLKELVLDRGWSLGSAPKGGYPSPDGKARRAPAAMRAGEGEAGEEGLEGDPDPSGSPEGGDGEGGEGEEEPTPDPEPPGRPGDCGGELAPLAGGAGGVATPDPAAGPGEGGETAKAAPTGVGESGGGGGGGAGDDAARGMQGAGAGGGGEEAAAAVEEAATAVEKVRLSSTRSPSVDTAGGEEAAAAVEDAAAEKVKSPTRPPSVGTGGGGPAQHEDIPVLRPRDKIKGIVIPVVLAMQEGEHRDYVRDWLVSRAAEMADGGPAPGAGEVLDCLQTVQGFLEQYEQQGVMVVNMKAGYFTEALDQLHDHILTCIERVVLRKRAKAEGGSDSVSAGQIRVPLTLPREVGGAGWGGGGVGGARGRGEGAGGGARGGGGRDEAGRSGEAGGGGAAPTVAATADEAEAQAPAHEPFGARGRADQGHVAGDGEPVVVDRKGKGKALV